MQAVRGQACIDSARPNFFFNALELRSGCSDLNSEASQTIKLQIKHKKRKSLSNKLQVSVQTSFKKSAANQRNLHAPLSAQVSSSFNKLLKPHCPNQVFRSQLLKQASCAAQSSFTSCATPNPSQQASTSSKQASPTKLCISQGCLHEADNRNNNNRRKAVRAPQHPKWNTYIELQCSLSRKYK